MLVEQQADYRAPPAQLQAQMQHISHGQQEKEQFNTAGQGML
jgi:hypothetical protein